MKNCGIEKSDHITWKLYILLRSVCYSPQIRPEVAEILDNEVTYPKNKKTVNKTNLTKVEVLKYDYIVV